MLCVNSCKKLLALTLKVDFYYFMDCDLEFYPGATHIFLRLSSLGNIPEVREEVNASPYMEDLSGIEMGVEHSLLKDNWGLSYISSLLEWV